MTSGVFSVFFLLVSLVFCASAVDPVGVKIRITDQAMNMLNREAQTILQETLLNRPFGRTEFLGCAIDRLTFTRLNIHQSSLRFEQNSGFRFVVQNFAVTVPFNHQFTLCFLQITGQSELEVEGVQANMELSLIRNQQGRLNVAMRTCEASVDRMALRNVGLKGAVVNKLLGFLRYAFNTAFCPLVQRFGVPYVSQRLDTVPMRAEVFPDFGISIDYSLTRDVLVTATSLDMSFKGLVFRQGENDPELPAVEPVFTRNNLMAYVGISEFVFNSAAVSFYNAGALARNIEQIRAARVALRVRQFFTKPWHMTAPLAAVVEVTGPPTIYISQAQGVTVNLRVRVRAVAARENREPSVVMSVSSTCQVTLRVTIEGNRLSLPSGNIECRIVTSNQLKKTMVKPLESLLNSRMNDFLAGWFYDGVQIPLPEGVIFTQGFIQYQDGFVVVGGNLNLTPAGRQIVGDGR